MRKNLLNITNRLFTAVLLLIALLAFQNITSGNTSQVGEIRIEEQETGTEAREKIPIKRQGKYLFPFTYYLFPMKADPTKQQLQYQQWQSLQDEA